MIVKYGIELEFYIENIASDKIIEKISNIIRNDNFFNKKPIIKKEKELNQLEVATDIYNDIEILISDLKYLKIILDNFAERENIKIIYDGQKFINKSGSALQFNFSLYDNNRKEEFNIYQNFIYFIFTNFEDIFPLLYENKDDLNRFDLELNKNLFKLGKYIAPINLTWSINNRTAMIRFVAEYNAKNTAENNTQIINRCEFRAACASIFTSNKYIKLIKLLNKFIYLAINNHKVNLLDYNKYPRLYINSFDDDIAKKILDN